MGKRGDMMSQITKRALADSLKKQLAKKPLERITVTDIAEDCGVNRQTFYYHFKDIYDLAEWVVFHESERVFSQKLTFPTWREDMIRIFNAALDNKPLALNAYRSLRREQIERYLYKVTYNHMLIVVQDCCRDIPMSDENIKCIADFYKITFVGHLLDWVRRGMKEAPEQVVGKLSYLLEGTMQNAINGLRSDK